MQDSYRVAYEAPVCEFFAGDLSAHRPCRIAVERRCLGRANAKRPPSETFCHARQSRNKLLRYLVRDS